MHHVFLVSHWNALIKNRTRCVRCNLRTPIYHCYPAVLVMAVNVRHCSVLWGSHGTMILFRKGVKEINKQGKAVNFWATCERLYIQYDVWNLTFAHMQTKTINYSVPNFFFFVEYGCHCSPYRILFSIISNHVYFFSL